MLTKENRLKKNKEFNYIFKKGKYINSSNFLIYYLNTRYQFSKFGISVSKKVGNSVVRSRTKRVMSEVIRVNLEKVKTNNYIIVLKPSFAELSFSQVEAEFLAVLKKNKLFKENTNV